MLFNSSARSTWTLKSYTRGAGRGNITIGRATTSNSKSNQPPHAESTTCSRPMPPIRRRFLTHRLPPPPTLRLPAPPFRPLPSLAGRGPHRAPSGLTRRLVHVSVQPCTVAERSRIRVPTHGRFGLVSARAPLPVRLLLAIALGLGAASLGYESRCQYWKPARDKRGTTDSGNGRKTRWSCWAGMSWRWWWC